MIEQHKTLPESYHLDAWRVFRILSEFVEGFEKMTAIGPSVVFFGSSRIKSDDPYYKMTLSLAGKISQKGFAIVTGGGPGIMEAANEGARANQGISCGLCIDLPSEEEPNPFIDKKYLFRFRYFFVRKVLFVRYAKAFVVMPGGFGTLNELFEALTLITTKKANYFPIYLIGKAYWTGLLEWLTNTTAGQHNISLDELNLLTVTDDLDEVADGIEKYYQKVSSLENF
ncbi:MAG TPA: TIGR00730 family Rossman fold protein [Rhabdochlamydiaceae bacterium]|nr:TIGR00730 family Rossman fold protein [Rhabdochlamydiaceae bacterium]